MKNKRALDKHKNRRRNRNRGRKQQEILQLTKERIVQTRRKRFLSWIYDILITLGIAFLVGFIFFRPVTMLESAMEPTMNIGDKYFVNNMSYFIKSPKRGDIVAFRVNGKSDSVLHIRRVIGLPGETVRIADGVIYINGAPVEESLPLPEIKNPGLAAETINLGANQYFVLGDNRNNSEDSRYPDIGIVLKKYIAGKVWFQYAPQRAIGWMN